LLKEDWIVASSVCDAQAADGHEIEIALVAELVWRDDEGGEDLVGLSGALRCGRVHFRDEGEGETLGHDADDGSRHATSAEGLADGGGIAVEIALPRAPGEDDFTVVAVGGFDGEKGAAEDGMNAEHVEEVGFDIEAADDFRVVSGRGEAVGVVLDEGDTGEGFGIALPVEEMRGVVGQRAGGQLGHVFAQHDEAVGTGEGEGLEQDRVDDREDGGDGADAEGQGEDGGEREAWRFAESAGAEAQVLQEALHEALLKNR
jgi:hypothetical protein